MVGLWSGKAKRKELEEVYDEFSDFSLLYPSRKIRRLDADMLSEREENERTATLRFNQQMPIEHMGASTSGLLDMGPVLAHNMPTYPPNGERSLVVYKAVEAPPLLPPVEPTVPFKVSSDLIHGIKNHIFKLGDQTIFNMDDKIAISNNCLALVPWVPSQATVSPCEFADLDSRSELLLEPMEAEETGAASMEVEENREQAAFSGVDVDGIQQWQQHCMTPQFFPNTPSPIMW